MHDRMRRLICRLLFVLLCALPTCSIVLWTCIVHSPPYQAARRARWESRLSEQLGVVVRLDRVREPNRGLRLLEGVNLRDPETDQTIVDVRLVEIREIGGQWYLTASQPEIQGDQVWRFWEVLHDHVLRARWQRPLRAQIFAAEATVLRADKQTGTTLTDFRCQLSSTTDGPQATIEFRDVALQMSQPVRVRATRNRRASPPVTRFELDTRTAALPCSLLSDQLPVLECFGDRASFQGTISATETARGWDADFSGRFLQVDLNRIVTGRYPHKLSGLADVTFQRARIVGGRLAEAVGELRSRGGVVSWSLLSQADRTLGLVADPRVRAVDVVPLWTYDELHLQFVLSDKGLEITGLCDGAIPGVVMADANGPLLRDRPQEVAQVVALVQTLASRDAQQVPHTAEAYQLLHVLPLPSDADSYSADNQAHIYTPVRLQ